MNEELNLTIDELAEAVGVPVRTIRFYISEGLLPGPGTRGKGSSYGQEHLLRLRLIRLLVERHVPLAEIRSQLAQLRLEEVRSLLAEEERWSEELDRRAQTPSPQEYVSGLLREARAAREPGAPYSPPAPAPLESMVRLSRRALEAPPPQPSSPPPPSDAWERWELAPGVELHVRADVKKRYRELIRRLLQVSR